MKNMKDKICLITGASSGIGKATAIELAQRGATVVMLCRNRAKGEAAAKEIGEKSGNDSVDIGIADFSSLASVRRFADWFKNRYNRLDILINNVGAVFGKRIITEDGLEATFAVNHIAPFLLTNLLLDMLKRCAPSRIVNVASAAERGGAIDFDDLQGEKRFRSWGAYSQSKLANILFTYEMARRLEGTGVTVNCLHPGVVASNFGNEGSLLMRIFLKPSKLFMIGPAKGAETSVYLASSSEVEEISGKYFIKKKQERSSTQSYNSNTAKKLWEVSEAITQLGK